MTDIAANTTAVPTAAAPAATPTKYDQINEALDAIDAEALSIGQAVDTEAQEVAVVLQQLQELKANPSFPENDAKLDGIIARLESTKQNFAGISDRIKGIVPGGSASVTTPAA